MEIKQIENIIRQSSRCALFAKVSEEAENIWMLLSDVDKEKSVSDEIVKTVERHLLVHSADEFKQRFPAAVYFTLDRGVIVFSKESKQVFSSAAKKTITFHRLELFERGCQEIWERLLEHQQWSDAKRNRAAYRLFRNEKGVEEIQAIRKDLIRLFWGFGRDKPDCSAKRQKNLLERIGRIQYDICSLLPLLAEESSQTEQDNEEMCRLAALASENYSWLEIWQKGAGKEKETIHLPKDIQEEINSWLNDVILVVEETREGFCGREPVKKHSDAHTPPFILVESSEWKELLLAVLSPVKNKKYDTAAYSNMYDQAVRDFCRTAKRMAELCLGVESYFKQGRGAADAMELLVLNIWPEELLDPKNRNKMAVYLNTVNGKNDFGSTIWMGILPGVRLLQNISGNIRQRFAGTGEDLSGNDTVAPETVNGILKLTAEYQILLFYQYETTRDASARSFANYGVTSFQAGGAVFEKSCRCRFLSCCYPNLTVLEDEIYIGAAFTAAGLTASLQSSRFLSLFYPNVKEGLPGIRFDLEEHQAYQKVTAAAPREIYPYGSQTKDELGRVKYGCLFASEDVKPGWGGSPDMMLSAVRTAYRTEGGYEPVYRVLAETYLYRLLRALTHDFKEDELRFQFSGAPESWFGKLKELAEYVNAPLKPEEYIFYEFDAGKRCRIIIDWDIGGK